MFENLIVQPILNVLIFIYAILPGHNFGLALLIFTILVRLAIHPLVRKQLHHGRAIKALQPEIDKIKQATKGDSSETSRLTMELYKEREISPFAGLGPTFIQVLVLLGLFTGLRHIADDPQTIIDSAYGGLSNFGFLKELAADISRFDFTLFGAVDLSRSVSEAGFYFPAFVLTVGATISQYFMGKQTLPEEADARSLRDIIYRNKSDQSKGVSTLSPVEKFLKFGIPVFIFWFTYTTASALALYWFVSGVVGYIQQRKILEEDEAEMLKTKPATKKPSSKGRITKAKK